MNMDGCGMATLKETERNPVRLQTEHTVTHPHCTFPAVQLK